MIDAKVLSEIARYDSATISNAIETFKIRPKTQGFVDSTLHCMYPALPPVIGTAVTCRLENSDCQKKHNLLGPLLDLLYATDGPTIVVCEYIGDDPARSCLVGDLVAAFFQRLGAKAVVTDCGARDIQTVAERAPGFQVFSRGVVASHGAGLIVEIGGAVTIGGLRVAPGDILHGDANGVVAVPTEIVPQVAAAAAKILEQEESLYRQIQDSSWDYLTVRNSFVH
jgi:4-hydroxy-4-methyl-2-oxoglutarate aldolase